MGFTNHYGILRPETPSALSRLIVFDLDGTLVDTLADLTASANRLLAAHGRPPVAPGIVRPMIGCGIPALVQRLLAHAGLATEPAAAIQEFAADYGRNAAAASRPFAGVTQTLRLLHQEGWRLAVCTNKPEAAARALLTALGLGRWMAAVGGGDSFPTRKPDRGHLLGTIRQAGGEPARAVLVGDHANDVAAARSAGVACIFALWGYGPPGMSEGSQASAETMAQVPGLARALLG